MELIFLKQADLSVLGHAFCDSDFEIIVDSLVPQKSKFTVNGTSVKAEAGDLVVPRGSGYQYVGVISSIEADEEKSTTEITSLDYLSTFDVDVPVSSYSGLIGQFLVSLIRSSFIASGDARQDIAYLSVANDSHAAGSLSYEDDKLCNIVDLSEEFSKSYGVRLSYRLQLSKGRFSGILVKAQSVTKGITLRSDLGTVSGLSVTDSRESSINKVIFVPKAENATHKSRCAYFLLTDGTVTADPSSALRFPRAKAKYINYSDDDYPTLLTKATSELVDTSLEHNVSFAFDFGRNPFVTLEDLGIGSFVEFITPEKTFESMVTKLSFKGTFDQATVTLGEHRVTLTEKLKLLSRKG